MNIFVINHVLCGAVKLHVRKYCLSRDSFVKTNWYLLIEAYLYSFGYKPFKTYNFINSFNTIKYLFIWGELWLVGTWCKSICGWSEVLSVIIPFISFKTPCGGNEITLYSISIDIVFHDYNWNFNFSSLCPTFHAKYNK